MASTYLFGSLGPVEPIEEYYTYFTVSGACSDEIQLRFDNENSLYVSRNFLVLASPDFEKMIEDCERKGTGIIEMKGTSPDDFQQFLLCLHPNLQKSIDKNNVQQVLKLAEKYKVHGSIMKCKEFMKNLLEVEYKAAITEERDSQKPLHVEACLQILIDAEYYGYDHLKARAIEVIARLDQDIYVDSEEICSITRSDSVNTKGRVPPPPTFPFKEPHNRTLGKNPIKEKCKHMFKRLPDDIKTSILLGTMSLGDNKHNK